ncbi:MAG: replicative helicase loader/inhibitor [Methanosphaera sp.]|nr:replicative helicase loader/inhibitor [Methanosphaera sp.]
MTNEQTIIKAITLLKTNYQNALKEYNEKEIEMMINAWCEFFKDIPEKEFELAIRNIINKSDFFPTIAQIKREIANNRTNDMPSAEDEWEEVIKTIHKFGSYRQQEAMEQLKDYTAYIVRHVGYQNICMSEDNTWNKKEFIAEYNQMKDREKELIQIDSKETLFNQKLLGNTNI